MITGSITGGSGTAELPGNNPGYDCPALTDNAVKVYNFARRHVRKVAYPFVFAAVGLANASINKWIAQGLTNPAFEGFRQTGCKDEATEFWLLYKKQELLSVFVQAMVTGTVALASSLIYHKYAGKRNNCSNEPARPDPSNIENQPRVRQSDVRSASTSERSVSLTADLQKGAARSHEAHDIAVNIRNEEETAGISSLSISEGLGRAGSLQQLQLPTNL